MSASEDAEILEFVKTMKQQPQAQQPLQEEELPPETAAPQVVGQQQQQSPRRVRSPPLRRPRRNLYEDVEQAEFSGGGSDGGIDRSLTEVLEARIRKAASSRYPSYAKLRNDNDDYCCGGYCAGCCRCWKRLVCVLQWIQGVLLAVAITLCVAACMQRNNQGGGGLRHLFHVNSTTLMETVANMTRHVLEAADGSD